MKTVSITVYGKVQGVFYRSHTVAEAIKNDISGFVINRSDGTVYIKATGTETDINRFIEWCYKGSPSSMVSKVTVENLQLTNFKGFEIRK